MNESPSAPSVPDKITAIRAWRAWALREDGRLFSLNAGSRGALYLWPLDRPLEALCLATGHDAPQENCTCGIYAHKDRAWIIESTANMGHTVGAIGIVKLSGKVIEAEKGYRAQFAEPEMLAVREEPVVTAITTLGTKQIFPSRMPVFLSVTSSSAGMMWSNAGHLTGGYAVVGPTGVPSPPSKPSNYATLMRNMGCCEECGAAVDKKGRPIPAGKNALCPKHFKPPEPTPEPQPEPEPDPLPGPDPAPTGIVALVAKNYPRCVVIPYSKLTKASASL